MILRMGASGSAVDLEDRLRASAPMQDRNDAAATWLRSA